jgi:ribonuclease HI
VTSERESTLSAAQPEIDTINRAELSAIWAALIAGHSRIASDSLGCIYYQTHKMVHRSQDLLDGQRHLTLLTAIRDAIVTGPPEAPPVVLLKVPAHVGNTGNESADAIAKGVAKEARPENLASSLGEPGLTVPSSNNRCGQWWWYTSESADETARPQGAVTRGGSWPIWLKR